jgi:tRNA-splicing ligase RtcB
MTHRESITTFGAQDDRALSQLERCLEATGGEGLGVLCADHHVGYSMPIGGVLASRRVVMPAGVGFDIACGNCAVRTDLRAADVDVPRVMDAVWDTLSFGVGRRNQEKVGDQAVFDRIATSPVAQQRALLSTARAQLGTIGSGNHYVDIFEDRADGALWVGVHFGSRGFGHRTASGFLALAAGKSWDARVAEGMDAAPTIIRLGTPLADDYLAAMAIAGEYAAAGRVWVVDRVLRLLGGKALDTVHNHHNFAWWEAHGGDRWLVVRKGATPAFPGQRGFVGGSMGDDAVILEGVESKASARALYSTVHGAGRVMSRSEAKGKRRGREVVRPGRVDWPAVRRRLKAQGVELRGGGADEAPECYKRLTDVVAAHAGTVRILHTLRPIGVAMAGPEVVDPYKD